MSAKGPNVKVVVMKSTFDFAIAEFQRIHSLLDLAGVPRRHDGTEFTVSQRVQVLVTVQEQLRAENLKAKGNAPH